MRSLCIDARWIYSGIGTYTLNMLRELSRRGEFELHCITLSEHRAALEPYCNSLSIVDVPIYSVREQFAIARAAQSFPVLHVPHYNAPLPRSGTQMVTIHDLTHILDARFRNTAEEPGLCASHAAAGGLEGCSYFHSIRVLQAADRRVS